MHSLIWLPITLSALVTGQGVSTSARCGPNFGLTCTGSVFGPCCSVYSYCGSTDAYCNVARGCQAGWGSCKGSSSSARLSSTSTQRISSTLRTSTRTASPSPSSTQRVSTNARCGREGNGQTCLSSIWGNCCSQWSYCGSNIDYCGTGCQQGFGQCNAVPSSSRSSTITVRSSTSSRSSSSGSVRISSSSLSLSTINSASSTRSSSASSTTASFTSASPSSSTQISSSARTSSSLEPAFSTTSPGSSPAGASSLSSSTQQTSSTSQLASLTTHSASVTPSPSYSAASSLLPSPSPSPSSSSISVSSSITPSSLLSSASNAFSTTSSDVASSVSAFATSSTFSSIESSASTIDMSSIGVSPSVSTSSPVASSTTSQSTAISDPEKLSTTSSGDASSSATTTSPSISSTDLSSVTSGQTMTASETTSSVQGGLTSQTSSTDLSSTIVPSSDSSSVPPTSSGPSTLTTLSTTPESPSASASSSTPSDAICNPIPSPTCKIADCAPPTNAVATPSASYLSIPVYGDHGYLQGSKPNVSVTINDLDVNQDYVLTFYGGGYALGSGSNSCCNMTAYMDNVAISRYCVGAQWSSNYRKNAPFVDSTYDTPRSPAVVYRPSTSNPALTFNIVCPPESQGVLVSSINLNRVSLVPRCSCQEEDKFQSIQSQPGNLAFNGNFADYNLVQENPVSGWVSQEDWNNQVIPVQYKGTAVSDDRSNSGSVVLMGRLASLYRPISNLVPYAAYNVSILWRDPNAIYSCTLIVKFDDTIVMEIPRTPAFTSLGTMTRNSTVVYPKTTSGTLWIGSFCPREWDINRKNNDYPTVRIDDVSFNGTSKRLGCNAD